MNHSFIHFFIITIFEMSNEFFDSILGCDIFKSPYYMENRFTDLNITAVSTSTSDSSNLLSNESNNSHNHSHNHSLTIHSTNENNAPQHNHNNNNHNHLNNNNNNNNHLNNGTSIKAEDETSSSNLIIEDQETNNR